MSKKKGIIQLAKNTYMNVSPTYYRTAKLIRRTEYLPEEELRMLQFRRLKSMLIHAYKKVPHYREVFRQAGVNPHDMVELDQIQDFPLLAKDQFRNNIDSFISEGTTKAFLMHAYTGGTTGTPTPLYRNLSDFPRENAFTDHAYQMQDMDPSCKVVHIRGEVDDKRGRYHRIGNLGRILYLSSHNMSDENLELYIKLIREFKPQRFYAVPSVATVFVEYMEKHGIPPFDGLRWAFCPSENLYKFQVELIEKVLQCRVGTFYGHSEHAVMASRCIKSTLYHVLPLYGYAELVDEDGRTVTEEGKPGEIVGTSFTNPCCPLVRYCTGDYAVYTAKKCQCGRNYPMWERIEGRGQAMAISKNGGRTSIGPDLLCTIHDTTYSKVQRFQIEQRCAGELLVRVIPYDATDIAEIQEYFKRVFAEQYPGSFDVAVESLEEIEISSSGKHLYFVQRLEIKNTEGSAESP